jgi:hypothetical protein
LALEFHQVGLARLYAKVRGLMFVVKTFTASGELHPALKQVACIVEHSRTVCIVKWTKKIYSHFKRFCG